MEYSITDYDYCIRELESMISYDGPPDNAFSYAPDSYPNDAGWNNCHHEFDNNTSSSLPIHAYSNLSIMDTSSDTFFSTFDPNFILSSRHAILPARVTFGDSSRLRQKISFISNTQQNLSNHTGRKKRMKYSSLGSSQQDESNGSKIGSLGLIVNEKLNKI
ncbi:hypothetical protein RhiirA5_440480 [Rhizophagus irregularis]|uniref:Uncharacterized protein n=1 Tax=Rhizophagus irregularis TaxID=588596 RepID=A0A2N0QV83_9GLOM|nr:hypothetical protein RhiirA5_440480 [Rhizophagus irregularis]PKC54956.1 hypothetical protein RhiirA1_476404 [Rhizophagus irregularis]